jgi:hypothetical protein
VPPEQDADMLAVVTLSQRMLEIVLGQILAWTAEFKIAFISVDRKDIVYT